MAVREAISKLKEPKSNATHIIPVADLVYEYVIENYLVKWYKAGTFSGHNYMKALQELDKLKHLKSKKKQNQDAEVKEVMKLPSTSVNDKIRLQYAQPNQGKPENSQQSHEHQKLILQLTDKNEELENRIRELDVLLREKSREMDRLTNDFDNASDEIQTLTMRPSKTASDILLREKSREMDRLTDDFGNASDEIQTLSMRPSKTTGDKLPNMNPDITNLTDHNRPTEIGKQYSEIYDNYWSDAYDDLPGSDENEKLDILHTVIQGAFEFCRLRLGYQLKTVENVLFGDEVNVKGTDIHHLLKDIQRQIAPATAKNVAKEFVSSNLKCLLQRFSFAKPFSTLNKYAEECAEVSWYMVVFDPPMVLSQGDVMKPFDVNIYMPYTRSTKDMKSPVVELNVWPALYLNLNGPLVAKGVAQPMDGKIK